MRRIKYLMVLLCAISSTFVISCNNQPKNSGTKSDEEYSASIGPEIYPEVIVQQRVTEEGKFMAPNLGLAFKNAKGEYVVFDNDADYTKLCQDARIVGNICMDRYYDLLLHGKCNRMRDEKFWNDSVLPWMKSITGHIRQYYYGDKALIPEDVFEVIDRYHYDNDPLQTDYTLRESSYNKKIYGTPSGYNNGYYPITFTPLRDLIIFGKQGECFTFDGDMLSPNNLVCPAPYLR